MSTDPTPDAAGIETALAVDLGFDFTPNWQDQVAGTQLNADASWYRIWGPEALVDANGNSQHDAGETFTDLNGDGIWGDHDALLGRIAFLVVDESGKIDPNGVISPLLPEEDAPVRSGFSPPEIQLPSNDYYDKRPLLSDGTFTDWFSWCHLAAGLGAPSASGLITLSPYSRDIEAYHAGAPPVAPATTRDNEHHRFDLFDAPWDDASKKPTVATLLGTADPFWDTSVDPPAIAPVSARGGAIPWLNEITPDAIRTQVAANLIDYCDSDDLPTTDFVPAAAGDPTAMPPVAPAPARATYCGLENVPYINEIAFRVSYVTVDPDPADGDDSDVTGTLTIQPYVELINIYGSDYDPPRLWVYLTVEIDGSARSETWILNPAGVSARGYAVVTNAANVLTTTVVYVPAGGGEPENTAVETNLAITDIRVFLSNIDPDNPAEIVPLDVAIIETDTVAADLADGDTRYASVQVADPRANTRNSAWAWFADAGANLVVTDLTMIAGSLGAGLTGAKNASADPSAVAAADHDLETVEDPAAGVSTAYVRNAPMQSLWELGAIHRGEAWRTINLKAYSAAAGDYSDGDAAILDQVKLGAETQPRGKVNLNSPVVGVWEYMFDNIRYGGTYEDPESFPSTPPVPAPVIEVDLAHRPDQRDRLVAAIVNANGAYGGSAFEARGRIADVSALSDGSVLSGSVTLNDGSTVAVTQDTDRAQEEIVGKIANLLTVRQNFFRVVVTGQSVTDLGTLTPVQASAIPGILEYDTTNGRYLRVVSEQRIMAIVYRDAFTGELEIRRYEYLDD